MDSFSKLFFSFCQPGAFFKLSFVTGFLTALAFSTLPTTSTRTLALSAARGGPVCGLIIVAFAHSPARFGTLSLRTRTVKIWHNNLG